MTDTAEEARALVGRLRERVRLFYGIISLDPDNLQPDQVFTLHDDDIWNAADLLTKYQQENAELNTAFLAARDSAEALAYEITKYQRVVEAARAAETVMMIVEPRSDKAEYLAALRKLQAALAELPEKGTGY